MKLGYVMQNKHVRMRRSLIIVFAIVLAAAVPLSYGQPTRADKYDDQIRALQKEIDDARVQADQVKTRIGTLQEELSGIEGQKRIIQLQIDISQAKYDKLVADIAVTEQRIADNKDALGSILANIYVDDTISHLEMLASSKNIGDYVDQQEYRESAKEQLAQVISEIKQLKADLEKQKTDVQRTLADQGNQRAALAAKESEQQQLISQARGEESAYQQIAADRESKKLAVQREQQAAIEAAMRAASGGRGSVILPGTSGGYPWNDTNCIVDANAWSWGGPLGGDGGDGMGYGCRQCVSYVAWRAFKETGYAPVYWGNANNWPGSARSVGFSTGRTPRANSAGVISAGQYGHIVWVDAVNSDGTIDISQYNYWNAGGPGWGHYSKMRVHASTYDTYIYF